MRRLIVLGLLAVAAAGCTAPPPAVSPPGCYLERLTTGADGIYYYSTAVAHDLPGHLIPDEVCHH